MGTPCAILEELAGVLHKTGRHNETARRAALEPA